MHPARKQKIQWLIALVLILALAIGLILYALRSNISLFYTTTDVTMGKTHPNQIFRLGGLVKKGSVKHFDGLAMEFVLTDLKNEVVVEYQGLLPDLFREGQGIVAQGKMLPSGHFHADEVLAKHDENYRPDQSFQRKSEGQSEKG